MKPPNTAGLESLEAHSPTKRTNPFLYRGDMIGDYVKKEKKNNPNTHSTTQTTRQIMIT
jgi:hypothetical protein